jgi:palmitoyltransferase
MNSKEMDFGRFVSLPVVVVLLIMGFVYHTVVVWVIQPWLSLSTASGLANAMLLTALCIMALVSYALAVIQDPGRVPSSYLPDLEDSAITLHEVKRKVFPSPCLL